MRALAFFFLATMLPLASGCYNAGDLGDEPFKCSETYPECPDNYICGTDPSVNQVGKLKNCPSKTNCVCVRL